MSHPRQLCITALLYFTADYALNALVLGEHGWQIFWPLNGLTIALLLARPRGEWVSFLAATQVPIACAEYLTGTPGFWVLLDGFSETVEVLLGGLLLPGFTDLETWLREPRLYPRFSMAVLIGPLLASAVAAAGFSINRGDPFLSTLLDFAPSEVIGVSATIPLVLAVRSVSRSSWQEPKWWIRTLVVLGATAAVMTGMFVSGRYPLLFLLYPLLMWIESILGLLGASIAMACACILATIFTQKGYGPFAQAFVPGHARNLSVELYLAFHLICFLPVSIMSVERRRLTRELHAALKRVTTLAAVDGLTGLSNRRTFDERLSEQWRHALSNHSSMSLLMIDVDYFKKYNDTLGHQAGDDCLCAVARGLQSQVSAATGLVARFGGEEFAILLPDTPIEDACRVAEAVRAGVRDLAITHPGVATSDTCEDRRVTVSIGCATLVPRKDGRVQDLLALADEALYLAKRTGRNRVCVKQSEDSPKVRGPAMRKLQDRIGRFRNRSTPGTFRG